MPSHFHAEAHLVLILAGHVELDCRKDRRRTAPGTLTFLPSGEPHANRFYEGARTFQAMIGTHWLGRLGQVAAPELEPIDYQHRLPNWIASRLYREFQRPDDLTPLALEGLMLELMVAMSRDAAMIAVQNLPRWLREARDLLHAQFTENISLEGLASTLGVHPAHLTRAFRQHYHTTIGDYVRRLRVEYACHLLTTSEVPLAQLALDLGFADQGHFSRIFKSHTGMSPAAFRKVSGFAGLR